jgi:hypothetical protein
MVAALLLGAPSLTVAPTVIASSAASGATSESPTQINWDAQKADLSREAAANDGGPGNSDFARRSWEWHLLSTKILFWLVIGIVLFGLYITMVQFRRDYSGWHKAPVAPHIPGSAEVSDPLPAVPPPMVLPLPSTLKIGPGGMEVTSQVVGLLVLSLSLAFFYLYIRNVYPIELVSVGAAKSAAPAKAHPEKPSDPAE